MIIMVAVATILLALPALLVLGALFLVGLGIVALGGRAAPPLPRAVKL